MENKLTMSGLAAMIALVSGQPGQLCEEFLKELFRIIGDELEKGENVRIKGLGTFKVTAVDARKSVDVATGGEIEIPAHRKVIFVASKDLAALVNAPFEAFEAVEVSDALPTDELLDIVEDSEQEGVVVESEIAETDESIDLEEREDASVSDNVSDVTEPDKSLEYSESISEDIEAKEVADSMTESETSESVAESSAKLKKADPSEKLRKAEAVGPVIITYDIATVKESHFGDEETDSTDSISGDDAAAVEVDDIEEKEEPGTPVISFSSPLSSAATRKGNIRDNDSGELDDKKSSAPKEPIKTIRFESAESNDDDDEVESGRNRSRFGSGFLIGFLSAIAIVAVVLLIGVKFNMVPEKVSSMLTKNSPVEENVDNVQDVANDTPVSDAVLSDSIIGDGSSVAPSAASTTAASNAGEAREDAVPTRASDEPVYDVVSTTRYLTTMAKEHYGNFNLWPIIYEENQSFLGHPDRIKPGTQVVIPPLSKYKVNPDNPEDVKRIKQKGVRIYSKYK